MLLLIDNYDSFSYNLYQLIGAIEPDIRVIRNDELSVSEILSCKANGLIISPGPGRPEDAGIITELVKTVCSADRSGEDAACGCIPILGVCLGHQAICQALGGTITYARELMHGKQSMTTFDKSSAVFENVPKLAPVARYHSLALDEATLPDSLRITARTTDGDVMAVEHRSLPIYGMQFHPESIMTPDGKAMLESFISITKK